MHTILQKTITFLEDTYNLSCSSARSKASDLVEELKGELKKISPEPEEVNDDNLWCKCEQEVGFANAYYVPDGAGVIKKHHWCCGTCRKVVQIG
jgi:hypothetical protein